MSGKEKKCTQYATIEFALNVVFSYLALKFFDMAMMALVRVFITFIVNFFGIMKTTGIQLEYTLQQYYQDCCRKTIIYSFVPLMYLTFFCYQIDLAEWGTLKFIIVSLSYGLLFGTIGVYLILEKEDKKIIINRFPKLKFIFPKLNA
tara:strand:- start:17 stop:457 length:441 start_codon:yes stop_codon:yes gene_type:complete